MNFKNIRIYIAALLLLTFWSCSNSDKQSPFQGDYLLNSIKLDECLVLK